MLTAANSRQIATLSADEIANLLLEFEAAKPARVVIANAKSGEVSYPWNDEASDYLAKVLVASDVCRAWLDGSNVMLEFI